MSIRDAHRTSKEGGSPASPSEVLRTMTCVGGPKHLGGSATAISQFPHLEFSRGWLLHLLEVMEMILAPLMLDSEHFAWRSH